MPKKRKEAMDIMVVLADKHRKGGSIPKGELREIELGLISGKGLRAPKSRKGSKPGKPLPRKKKKKKNAVLEFAILREKKNGG